LAKVASFSLKAAPREGGGVSPARSTQILFWVRLVKASVWRPGRDRAWVLRLVRGACCPANRPRVVASWREHGAASRGGAV